MKKILAVLIITLITLQLAAQKRLHVIGGNTLQDSNIAKSPIHYIQAHTPTPLSLPSFSDVNKNVEDSIKANYSRNKYPLKQWSYVAEETDKNPADYSYIVRNGKEYYVMYIYGTKAVVYYMLRDSAYGMRYISRVYSADVDTTTGLVNFGTVKQNTINWMGIAIRYKVPDSSQRAWFPYHAGSLSAKVSTVDSTVIIDGKAMSVPTTPLRFSSLTIKQKITASYANNGVNEMEWNLYYNFDNRQLSIKNEINVLKNIDVERAYGSRLSLDSCAAAYCNDGTVYTNLYNNATTSYENMPTSVKMENNKVYAYSDIGDAFFNISQDKSYFAPAILIGFLP